MGFFHTSFLARFKLLNPLMLACMLGLLCLGVLFIYSACSIRENPKLQLLYVNHLAVAGVGLAAYFAAAALNYRRVMAWRWVVYAGCLAMLMVVPVLGESRMGGQRWLFGIQPSEPAKLAIIMALAGLMGRRGAKRGFWMFVLSVAMVAVPALFILMQPDLGTAMVLVPTLFAMLLVANVAPKTVWACVLAGALGASVLLGAVYYSEKGDLPPERRAKIVKMTGLRPHQVQRLKVFLFPDKDLHGSGYNRRQSEIAVGSGGRWGKGYLKGEQYSLGYLPPSIACNDFIFSVLAEEAGFTGSLTVLLLYLGLLGSGLWVACKCQDDTGRLLCVGVVTLIFSHAFINIGMTIGIMPITGLPLPFISYGGTFTLTMMVAFGLLQSVSIHGREPETRF
jgi:rod shape determining protein RodA